MAYYYKKRSNYGYRKRSNYRYRGGGRRYY